MTLEEKVDKMRGGKDEWWRKAGRAAYQSLAKKLVEKGLTEDEAIAILRNAFWSAAGEFGGDKV